MTKNTNISIIQLIKASEISVEYEIANIRSDKDINIHISTYLRKSDYFNDLQKHMRQVRTEMNKAEKLSDKLHLDQKLQYLHKIEQDFIANTLYLAQTLAKIEPRTDKLKKTIELFEQAKIMEADAMLNEADLLNDQYNLLAFVEYQAHKIKRLEDDL